MKFRKHIVRMIGAWLLFGGFLVFFSPNGLPVVFLIVPFALLFIALYSLWTMMRELVAHRFERPRTHRRLGMAVCLSAVFLLLLQSLGQLTLRDVVTVMILVVLGYLYFGRASFGLPRR